MMKLSTLTKWTSVVIFVSLLVGCVSLHELAQQQDEANLRSWGFIDSANNTVEGIR